MDNLLWMLLVWTICGLIINKNLAKHLDHRRERRDSSFSEITSTTSRTALPSISVPGISSSSSTLEPLGDILSFYNISDLPSLIPNSSDVFKLSALLNLIANPVSNSVSTEAPHENTVSTLMNNTQLIPLQISLLEYASTASSTQTSKNTSLSQYNDTSTSITFTNSTLSMMPTTLKTTALIMASITSTTPTTTPINRDGVLIKTWIQKPAIVCPCGCFIKTIQNQHKEERIPKDIKQCYRKDVYAYVEGHKIHCPCGCKVSLGSNTSLTVYPSRRKCVKQMFTPFIGDEEIFCHCGCMGKTKSGILYVIFPDSNCDCDEEWDAIDCKLRKLFLKEIPDYIY